MKKGLGLLMPLFLMACSQQATISKTKSPVGGQVK